jgi:4-amino-4-deoxy-L-arabinose transferase-like glycosyltransferase
MNKSQKVVFGLIIGVAIVLRFYVLDKVPAGIHADEASQGFNAFSLLKTGKDMYGQSFPILFRANGSYQPPIYTYLTIIPTIFLGNSITTARLVSALSGVGLVMLTYFFMRRKSIILGLIAAGIVAISPWAINFSRLAVEANLGVLFFAVGVFLLIKSIEKISFFPWACLILGLSTHAYYSERITSILILVFMLVIYRKIFLKTKKQTVLGLGIFAITLLPHVYILFTGALTKRLSQVGYLGDSSQNILKEFANHFIMYLSPNNLFFDPGSSLGRTTPDLGVFYPWMVIPFLAGLGYMFKNRQNNFIRTVWALVVITPIPAALTGDLFYPLRTLDYLWIIALIISFGCWQLWVISKNIWIKSLVTLGLVGYSLFIFGLSYFVIFKYELAITDGEPYTKLVSTLENYKDKQIWVDASDRAWGVGIRDAYLEKVDPNLIQASLKSQMQTDYYSQEVNAQEVYTIGNKVFKPINWGEICGKNLIVVGDNLSFDPNTLSDHQLNLEFTVPDYLGAPVLFGYSTTRLCK